MALISACITEVRTELSDDGSTRFTDTQLLNLYKKAIRRANRICQRNGIAFAKKKASLSTVASQAYIDYSSAVTDFDIWIGLFRDGNHTEIPRRNESDWETNYPGAEMNYCLLDQANSKIYLDGTPSSVETLTLWYYPTVDPSAYTTASSTPWNGRLDDIINEYVAIRAKNIDEMDASFDQALMSDMERQILEAYAFNAVNVVLQDGWLP